MRKNYETPILQFQIIEVEEIICTSGPQGIFKGVFGSGNIFADDYND